MNAKAVRAYYSVVAALRRDRGANLVEYTLLVAFIALICVAAISAIGDATQTPLSEASSGIGN